MLRKYKHIVFDLDGTLVHTEADYRKLIVPKTLEKLGITGASLQTIDKFWLEGNRDITIKEEFGCDPFAFWEIFREEDKIEERLKFTKAYDDVIDALKTIKQIGKDLAIITDAPPHIAEPEMNLLPEDLFSWKISIQSLGHPAKPDPKSFIHCLENFKIDPSSCVYIGNSETDGIYAFRAGVDFIHVDRGERKVEWTLNGKRITSLLELC